MNYEEARTLAGDGKKVRKKEWTPDLYMIREWYGAYHSVMRDGTNIPIPYYADERDYNGESEWEEWNEST